MTAQSNQRRIRLMLRQREPELAGQLNRAVRTMPCGPGCRLHPDGLAFPASGGLSQGTRETAQEPAGQPSGV